MHLNDELVQRTLHGELALHDVVTVRAHTAQCSACRELLERARLDEETVDTLLLRLDHGVPPLRATVVMNTARRRSMRWLHYAAALLLLTTLGGVAYAASDSPLPRLMQRVVSWVRSIPRTAATTDASKAQVTAIAPIAPTTPESVSGVAVAPGRSLTILFATEQTGGGAHVTLTDHDEVIVRAPTGAAEFTSTDGRLAIVNKAPDAVYGIDIPRRATHIEIRVHGRRVFVLDAGRITSGASAADGRYLLSLH